MPPQPAPTASRPGFGWLGMRLLRDLRDNLLDTLDALQRNHGDVVQVRIGPYRQVFLFDPAMARQVLVNEADAFARSDHALRVLRQRNGDSLLMAEGDHWRRLRGRVQPALQHRRVRDGVPVMWDQARQLCDRWMAALTAGPDAAGLVRDVQPDVQRLTLQVIARTLCGTDLAGDAQRLGTAVAALGEAGANWHRR